MNIRPETVLSLQFTPGWPTGLNSSPHFCAVVCLELSENSPKSHTTFSGPVLSLFSTKGGTRRYRRTGCCWNGLKNEKFKADQVKNVNWAVTLCWCHVNRKHNQDCPWILFCLLCSQVSMGADGRSYVISGQWDPCDPSFQILNTETPKGTDPTIFVAMWHSVNCKLWWRKSLVLWSPR